MRSQIDGYRWFGVPKNAHNYIDVTTAGGPDVLGRERHRKVKAPELGPILPSHQPHTHGPVCPGDRAAPSRDSWRMRKAAAGFEGDAFRPGLTASPTNHHL